MINGMEPQESVDPEPSHSGLIEKNSTERPEREKQCEELPTLKLSINEITTYRWSLLEDVVGYREAGVEAIGLWRPKLVEFGEERGVDLLNESGLSVSSVSWAGGFTGSNGHSYQEALDDAREAIRVAAEMNARSLITISGARAGHTSNHARRLFCSALRSLADLAAEHGIFLAIQPMHRMFSREWTFLTTLDATMDILNRCDHPYLKMAFGTYHLWQEPRLIERIPEIAPLVASVQLSDWREPPRSDNDRCLLGEGAIPLKEIIGAFVRAGYDGYYEVEIWSEEIWKSDYIQLLKKCCSQFDDLCPRDR